MQKVTRVIDLDSRNAYDRAYKAAMADRANMAQVYPDSFPSFTDWCWSHCLPAYRVVTIEYLQEVK